MYSPIRGERVWVSGCQNEFIVQATDHATLKTSIATTSDFEAVREGISYRLRFAQDELAAAQEGVANPHQVRAVLLSSYVCIAEARVQISEALEAVRQTQAAIQRSLDLISQSDQTIARWRTLNRKADRNRTTASCQVPG